MSAHRLPTSIFRSGRPKSAPLNTVVRRFIAESILRDGHARHASKTIASHRTLAAALHGIAFPTTPNNIPRRSSERYPLNAALEILALSLSNSGVSAKLKHFEHIRDEIVNDPRLPDDANASERQSEVEASQFAERFSSKFGYSNWLTISVMGLLSLNPNQSLLPSFLNKLRNSTRNAICIITAIQCYHSHFASASSELVNRIDSLHYPLPVKAFLKLMLDPHPKMSIQEAEQALCIAFPLPAIDRWVVLIKTLQSLSIYHPDVLSSASTSHAYHATIQLLSRINSIECHNILKTLDPSHSPPPAPTHIDLWLLEFINETPINQRTCPPLIRKFLFDWLPQGAAHQKNLTSLRRSASALIGHRTHGIINSIYKQITSLSERYYQHANDWLILNIHPDVQEALHQGDIGEIIRIMGVTDRADRAHLRDCISKSRLGDYQTVIEALLQKSQLTTEDRLTLVDCLLQTGDYSQAIEHCSHIIVEDTSVTRRLPLHEIEKLTPDSVADSLGESVHRAIVLDACVHRKIPSAISKRNENVDDVFTLSGVKYPAMLIELLRKEHLSPASVVYFLHSICTFPVLDTVPVGTSTEDLLNARIALLNALREMHPAAEEAYELEIREVATAIAIRSEMTQVDQQRVYVDIEGLRSRLIVQLSDDFDRYSVCVQLDPRRSEQPQILQLFLDTEMDVIVIQEYIRNIPRESDAALMKMILDIRSEFATSQDFGLDGYLSGGIRHGNLEAHLREPFVKYGLLGTFTESGFSPPKVIIQVLEGASGGPDRIALQAFQRFTQDFQSIVDEVLSEWIRIDYSPLMNTSKAIFNLEFNNVELRKIEKLVKGVRTVSEFVELLIGYWMQRVDLCLEAARRKISGELQEKLHAIHSQLDKTVRGSRIEYSSVCDNFIAPASGAIDTTLQKLADWFRRGDINQSGAVDWSIPFEISRLLMTHMYPEIHFNIEQDIQHPTRITRRTIKPWVDILHTLFMNTVKHGGHENICKFQTTLEQSNSCLTLHIVGGLGPRANILLIDSGIKDATDRLRQYNSTTAASISVEGKSGLIKVLKWARVDLRCELAEVSIAREDDRVTVKLHLPTPVFGLES